MQSNIDKSESLVITLVANLTSIVYSATGVINEILSIAPSLI